jgi:cytochrome c-type biogenesis protein CcmH
VARLALAAALALVFFLPAHAQKTERAKAVGHRLFCMCGCKQILVECNHVGCTMSTAMLKKLDAEIESGKSDDLVVQAFVQEFGAQVVAEPPAKGFNLLGWIMPFVAVALGFLLVRAALTRWYHPAPAVPGGVAPPPEMLERVRRETDLED